ncbi:MAG: hypothetical protein EOO41_04450 [Methanobacteriota archaeon]|nr:MAG: hypothetical protein EOO41_04450 [Euryarchaeota archaeon]
MEERAAARIAARAAKAAEKEEQRRVAAAVTTAERAMRGAFAKSEIAVQLESSFANTEVGAAIAAGVAAEYSVLPSIDSPLTVRCSVAYT